MLSSKANAALSRLKEIEEKYKMRRKQQNWNREEDSSISSVSIDPSDRHSARGSLRNGSKLRLDVKIPDMRLDSEKATSNDATSSLGDKVDPDLVASVRKNALQEGKDKKQENVSTDITTVQENSSINGALSIGSTNSSSTKSRSRTSRRDDAGNNKVSEEGRTRAMQKTTKVERERQTADRSEIAERRTSSITKGSRMSKGSKGDASKLPSDLTDRPFKAEAVAEGPETANLDENSGRNSNRTESLNNDNSIIEESIDTIADGSEIISEVLSPVDESAKIEDSRQPPGDVSVTLVESTKHVAAENASYANDTFEDVSGSTARSKSKFQNEKVAEINDGSNDDGVVDLTIPKSDATERDLESASDLERTGSDLDNTTAHLMKANSTDSSLERTREERSQRQSELEENIPSATSRKNVSSVSKWSTKRVVTQTHANMMAQRKSSSSRMTRILEIDQQENSSKIARKTSENSAESKAELKEDTTTTRRNVTAKSENERHRSSVKDQEFECNKQRETRAKVGSSKSVKARGSTGSREAAKALNLDGKQLRKRIVELRLRQEREDLQKYLRQLKDLRLESSSRSYFSPLEFPKIAEFTLDTTDSESKVDDRAAFRERVSAIRRWLKDQYILYRDYCTMAQAINAHYVPTTLEDAKRMIHGSHSDQQIKTEGGVGPLA